MAVDSSQIALAVGDTTLKMENQRTPFSEVKSCNCELGQQIPTDETAYVDVTPQKDGGITKFIIAEGHGCDRPVNGDTVSIRYEGKLADGTLFDTSAEQPFMFTIGSGSHLQMFEIAVMSMKCGERAVFRVHWDYAYGQKGSPPEVPPNTSLMIDVELIDWQGEDVSEEGDGSIYKSQLKKGEGIGYPNEGATCEIYIVGRCRDRVFQDRVVRFQLGEGSEVGIVEGVEIALKRFSRGEKARLKIKSSLAYGAEGYPAFSIPPNSDLVYEVELRSCERVKEFFDMTLEEKLEQSVIAKDKGTQYYKAGKIKLALHCYKKVVEYLQFEESLEGSAREQRTSLLLAAYLNEAACLLKLNSYKEAAEACSLALTIDPICEKALYRRGQANHGLQNFEDAMKDFRAVLNIDPDNRTARFQLSISERLLWDLRQKEKKTYRAMFKKLSEEQEASAETRDVPEYSAEETVLNASSDPQTSVETRDAQGDTAAENVPRANSNAAVDPQTSVEAIDAPGNTATDKVSKPTSDAAVDPQTSFETRGAPGDTAADKVSKATSGSAVNPQTSFEARDAAEDTATEVVSKATSGAVDQQTSFEARDAPEDTATDKASKATSGSAVNPQSSFETRDAPEDTATGKVSKATSGTAVDQQTSFEARDALEDTAAEVVSRATSDAIV